jgi:hypothetical protein
VRCVSDLEKLRLAVIKRSHWLDRLWHAAQPLDWDRRRAVVAFCVLELDNLLVAALRQFTKSSLLCCRTVAGHRVRNTSRVQKPAEAAALVLKELNRKRFEELEEPVEVWERFEQTFREPRDARRVLELYGATNLPSLFTGMAYNGQIFSEIGTARNFFAHRNQSTAERINRFGSNAGLPLGMPPESIVAARKRARPVSIFEDWNADLRQFFNAATQ